MEKRCRAYLVFMALACSGALLWQALAPHLAAWSSWGVSPGWQREIALWNVALVVAIAFGLLCGGRAALALLVLQCTVLCLVLGLNHAFALLGSEGSERILHLLGTVEVLVIGAGWGMRVLVGLAGPRPKR